MIRFFLCPTNVEGEVLSGEIYKIMYPENINVETTHAFNWIKKGLASDVIMLDDSEDSPIFIKSNFQLIIAKIAVVLENHLLKGEGDALVAKLSTQERINLIDIIPSSFVEVDRQWLIDNGYIAAPTNSLIAELN